MPQPKSVKIGGVEIEDVQSVSIGLATPTTSRGEYDGRTSMMKIEILRRARNSPTSEMYKLATNSDGRLTYTGAEIVLQDAHMKETYTIDCKDTYICGWEFHQPPEDTDMLERITLMAGGVKLSGGGKSAEFKVPDVKRTA